ncbi:uncharacterized protein UTRI_02795 [Ustilago trichophora]|uniref:Uncharacterized protein n=1 Tax=Ustilago trichophora TaxID=86804 RepID=A0A5C3ENV8_9BASI|nr:uncharacterized protein UTRI_02795 [Ustilago trichophora]
MDENRASAARKLPQTAANFFVGTNSRVPRMTLAQSSHIIPMPVPKSPGLKPKSGVVLNRLRPSPFPNSPTSSRAATSPRSVTTEGGKVAKAVQIFSASAEEEGSSVPDVSEPRRDAVTSKMPSGHLSGNTSTLAPKTEAQSPPNRADLAPPPPSKNQAADLDVSAPTSTSGPPPRQTRAAWPMSAEGREPIFYLRPKPNSDNHSITAQSEGSVLFSHEEFDSLSLPDSQTKMVAKGERQLRSSDDAALLHTAPRTTTMNETDTQEGSTASLHKSLFASDSTGTSNPRPSTPEELHSVTENNHGNDLSREVDAHSQGADAAEEIQSEEMQVFELETVDSIPTLTDTSLVLPSLGTNPTESSPTILTADPEALESSLHARFPRSSDPAPISVPKSAFSDASVPSASPIARDSLLDQAFVVADSRDSQLLPKATKGNTEMIEHSNPLLTLHSAPRLAEEEDGKASAAESHTESPRSSTRQRSPEPSLEDALPMQNADQPSSTYVTQNTSVAQGDEKGIKVDEGVVANGKAELRNEGLAVEAALSHNMEGLKRSETRVTEADASEVSWEAEIEAYVDIGRTDSEAAFQGQPSCEIGDSGRPDIKHYDAVIESPGREVSRDAAELSQISLPQHNYEAQPEEMLYPASITDEEILSELIDQVGVPTPEIERAKPRDSLIERTASWIKTTLEEADPTEMRSAEFQHEDADLLSVASTALSEMAERTLQAEALGRDADSRSIFAGHPGQIVSPPRVEKGNSAAPHSLEQPELFTSSDEAARVSTDKCSESGHPAPAGMALGIASNVEASVDQAWGHKIGRSYSQRSQPGGTALKQIKKIPGRLKIPQRQPEVTPQKSRERLELLSVRKTASATQTIDSTNCGKERSTPTLGTIRSNNFDDVLRSWSRPGAAEANPVTPPSRAKHRVGQLVKDWDENLLSSEDEEVASVAVCKRLTLRRMSDFTVHSTPRRDPRPLPGKLPQQTAETSPSRKTQTQVRALRQVQPVQVSSEVPQRVRPGRLKAREVQSESLAGRERLALRAKNAVALVLQEPPIAEVGPKSLQTTGEQPAVTTHHPTTEMRGNFEPLEPQEILRSRDSVDLTEEYFDQASPIEQTTLPTTAPRVEASTLKPLRLQATQSTFSTPRKPDVSVSNTSPHTVLSDLWTPNTSNPADSALTDETCVSKSGESRPHSVTRSRVGERSAQHLLAHDASNRLPSVIATHLSSHEQRWRTGPDRANSLENSTAARNHAHHQAPPPIMHFQNESPPDAPLQAQYRQDVREERPRKGLEAHTSRQGHGSGASVPGFEISFQLKEPRMAPHCPQGSLFEFGLQVLIKPIGESSADASWRMQPPSQLQVDARLRNAPSVDARQYEYSNLPSTEMSKVQEEAQAYLLHTLATPQQRDRRNTVESSRLSASVAPRGLGNEAGLSSPFLGPDAAAMSSPASSKRPYREMMLTTRSRNASVSQQSAISSVLSSAVHPADRTSPLRRRAPSTGLASPLPYIKRAPPRSVSSTFSTYS